MEKLTEQEKASLDKQLEQLARGLERWMLAGAAIFIALQIIRAIML